MFLLVDETVKLFSFSPRKEQREKHHLQSKRNKTINDNRKIVAHREIQHRKNHDTNITSKSSSERNASGKSRKEKFSRSRSSSWSWPTPRQSQF